MDEEGKRGASFAFGLGVPSINAFVSLDREGAMQAAEAAAERQAHGVRLSALDGIPIAIKDNIFVKGSSAGWGSLLYQDYVPDVDDIVVERLRKAGAVLIGKTTTPEFAMSARTESRLSGVTRNPWDLSLTPGGSSGGAVAAVAAGLVPLAVATDAGGSTRLPASYTGLVGLRPSNGRLARCNGFPPMALDFQAIGLITRSVRDLALAFATVSGSDTRDPSSLWYEAPWNYSKEIKTIGWFDRVGLETVDPEVRQSLHDGKAALEACGFILVECEPPYDVALVRKIWDRLTAAGAARNARAFPDTWRAMMTPAMVQLAIRGLEMSSAEIAEAFDMLMRLRTNCSANWQGYDALLTPTGAAPAWAVEHEAPPIIDGTPGSSRQNMFCGWVNALGYAGLNLPSTPHPDGRPIGIQLVGRHGDDERLMGVAERYEQVRGWQVRWPALALNT